MQRSSFVIADCQDVNNYHHRLLGLSMSQHTSKKRFLDPNVNMHIGQQNVVVGAPWAGVQFDNYRYETTSRTAFTNKNTKFAARPKSGNPNARRRPLTGSLLGNT